jgi:hypothetical protein
MFRLGEKKRRTPCKVVLLIALGAFAVFILVACGGKPANMAQETYEYGQEAVRITESYLNGGTSKETAYDRLSSIYEDLDDLVLKDTNERTENTLVRGPIMSIRSSLFLSMDLFDSGEDYTDDIIESLGRLKDVLEM